MVLIQSKIKKWGPFLFEILQCSQAYLFAVFHDPLVLGVRIPEPPLFDACPNIFGLRSGLDMEWETICRQKANHFVSVGGCHWDKFDGHARRLASMRLPSGSHIQ